MNSPLFWICRHNNMQCQIFAPKRKYMQPKFWELVSCVPWVVERKRRSICQSVLECAWVFLLLTPWVVCIVGCESGGAGGGGYASCPWSCLSWSQCPWSRLWKAGRWCCQLRLRGRRSQHQDSCHVWTQGPSSLLQTSSFFFFFFCCMYC